MTELIDDLKTLGVDRDAIVATVKATAKTSETTLHIIANLFELLKSRRE